MIAKTRHPPARNNTRRPAPFPRVGSEIRVPQVSRAVRVARARCFSTPPRISSSANRTSARLTCSASRLPSVERLRLRTRVARLATTRIASSAPRRRRARADARLRRARARAHPRARNEGVAWDARLLGVRSDAAAAKRHPRARGRQDRPPKPSAWRGLQSAGAASILARVLVFGGHLFFEISARAGADTRRTHASVLGFDGEEGNVGLPPRSSANSRRRRTTKTRTRARTRRGWPAGRRSSTYAKPAALANWLPALRRRRRVSPRSPPLVSSRRRSSASASGRGGAPTPAQLAAEKDEDEDARRKLRARSFVVLLRFTAAIAPTHPPRSSANSRRRNDEDEDARWASAIRADPRSPRLRRDGRAHRSCAAVPRHGRARGGIRPGLRASCTRRVGEKTYALRVVDILGRRGGAGGLMETDVEVDIAPSHEYEEAMARLAAAESARLLQWRGIRGGGGGGGHDPHARGAREARNERARRRPRRKRRRARRRRSARRGTEPRWRRAYLRNRREATTTAPELPWSATRRRTFRASAAAGLDQNQAIDALGSHPRGVRFRARGGRRGGGGTLQTRHAVAEDDVGGGGGGRAIRARKEPPPVPDSRALRGKNRRRIPTGRVRGAAGREESRATHTHGLWSAEGERAKW